MINELIRIELDGDPNKDPRKVAEKVYTNLASNEIKKEFLDLIVGRVESQQRAIVRQRESYLSTFIERATSKAKPKPPMPPDVKALLTTRLKVGDGTPDVTWGKATLEQLKARKEMLVKQRDALTTDIDRLDQAIKLLEQTGAGCLNQLS